MDMLQYVQEVVGAGDKVGFVGHGHGATLMLMNMTNYSKHLEDKLCFCVCLAPLAYSTHVSNKFYDFYMKHWKLFKMHAGHELFGTGSLSSSVSWAKSAETHRLEMAILPVFEANKQFDDAELSQVFMGHCPDGGMGSLLLDHLG